VGERYLIIADFEYPERKFEEFEKWIRNKKFDKLVLLGDMASKHKAEEFYRKVTELLPEREVIYVKGNTERFSNLPVLKDSFQIGALYLEHGHRFDPTYGKIGELIINSRQRSRISRLLFKYILTLRGFMKISYNKQNVLKEGEKNKVAVSFSKMGRKKMTKLFERLYLTHLFNILPQYSILAHVHSLGRPAYRCGDRKLFFIPPFPDYAALENSTLKIYVDGRAYRYRI